jgi:hypothetical protein
MKALLETFEPLAACADKEALRRAYSHAEAFTISMLFSLILLIGLPHFTIRVDS